MRDMAQIQVCLVQMARGDLRHLCAIKYKSSVCQLCAANWHFADCGLSVSHGQILAAVFTPQRLLMMSATRGSNTYEPHGKYLHTGARMDSHQINLRISSWEGIMWCHAEISNADARKGACWHQCKNNNSSNNTHSHTHTLILPSDRAQLWSQCRTAAEWQDLRAILPYNNSFS